jgi:hypothetical protein
MSFERLAIQMAPHTNIGEFSKFSGSPSTTGRRHVDFVQARSQAAGME